MTARARINVSSEMAKVFAEYADDEPAGDSPPPPNSPNEYGYNGGANGHAFGPERGDSTGSAFAIEATPYQLRDPVTIPRREYLFGRHYVRRAVSATVGGGGRGKTTLIMTEIIGMACGRDLMSGENLPGGPIRAWYLNAEEDQDELDRRVASICQCYGLTQRDFGDRLFVQSVRDAPLRIAEMNKNGRPFVRTDVRDALATQITMHAIDALAVDPLVSFHSVPENDNGAMDLVCKDGFGSIAGQCGIAVDLAHHPGKAKPGQAETVVEDARGASAVVWAVRNARTVNFMTLDEAAKLGIGEDDRRRHVRIANGKANMGPLGKAEWMRIEVENLANGDEVAVATPWKPPNPFDGVSVHDLEVVQKVVQGGAFRVSSQSKDWLGWWMAENLPDLNIKSRCTDRPRNKAEVARLNAILKTWCRNNVLDTEEREDKSRQARRYFVTGSGKGSPSPSTDYDSDDDQIRL
jgi:hypothetical protein